jgi:hypothetical protein
MSILANLIDPRIFAQLDEHEFERIEAALNVEVVSDPKIQAILKERVQKFLPHLKTAAKQKK